MIPIAVGETMLPVRGAYAYKRNVKEKLSLTMRTHLVMRGTLLVLVVQIQSSLAWVGSRGTRRE